MNRATGWYRTLWQDSNPHETHLIKMYRPILKDMGGTVRRRRCLQGACRLTVLEVGVIYLHRRSYSAVSNRPCTTTEEMPSSVESGAGPSIRGGSWRTKRRVDFAIDDGDSEALGSKSSKFKGYVAMQTRSAAKKKEQHRERAQAAGKPAKGSNTTKRVKKSSGIQGSEEKDEKRGRALLS